MSAAPTPRPGGLAYINNIGAYDSLYRPTRTRVIVPSAAGEDGLKGTYSASVSYNLDGTVCGISDPAAGGLPAESMIYGYNELGMPKDLNGAAG